MDDQDLVHAAPTAKFHSVRLFGGNHISPNKRDQKFTDVVLSGSYAS